jgi:putative glutamine amidotransferase
VTEPLIAVAGRPLAADRVRGWHRDGVGVQAPYIEAIHRAGGIEAVLLPVELDADDAARRLARFDGFLLIGGGDLDPAHYGEQPHPAIYDVEPRRDAFELALARAAVEGGVPTLAICRGIQVLNVALGGTLRQHIDDAADGVAHGDPASHRPVTHAVRLAPGSRVARAMGIERTDASSHHHQALAKLGTGLVATGWAADEVVEALEHQDGWVVGVQWHPEDTCLTDRAQQGLFEALVRRAAG